MTNNISVRNGAGQVVSFSFTSDTDPRKTIVEQRIARGELEKVAAKSESEAPGFRVPVEDYQTGLRDEKGDLLKSIHGGGVDPDALGDVLGQPSGSAPVDGAIVIDGNEPVGDSHPDAAPAAKRTVAKKTASARSSE